MFVNILRDFGKILLIALAAMGLVIKLIDSYNLLWDFLRYIPMFILCVLVFVAVSYLIKYGATSLYLILTLLGLVLFGMKDYQNSVEQRDRYYAASDRFTNSLTDIWEVSGEVRPKENSNIYTLCKLQGGAICIKHEEIKFVNYYPGQRCTILGDIALKKSERLTPYDFLKHTYLQSYKLEVSCTDTYKSKLFKIRDSLIHKINRLLPAPQSSLLIGMIFGTDLYFNDGFDKDIKSAGISHIVAASGYNVTILTVALDKILVFFKEKPKLLIKILFIWLYALLTGFSSSMVRASAMTSVGYIAKIFALKADLKDILWATAAILLLANPLIIFDIGFLLSFFATFGLIYLSPKLEKLFPFSWFPSTTIACTLCTLPITLIYFNTFSMYSILANVLILPVLEVVMLIGILGLVLPWVIYIAWGALKYVEVVSGVFGSLPYSIVTLNNTAAVVVSMIILFLIILLLNERKPSLNTN